ncbi:glycosyltransferase family 4 protein [bacterium]|nr:glycosyltransferase family 4 protein [bacterium]
MNICIDAHLSENQLTGIGRYLNGLIPELIQQGQRHYWTLLLTDNLESNHPLSMISGPNVQKIPVGLRGPSLKQHLVTSRILRTNNIDLYHHPHFDLPYRITVPTVATIHDLKYIRHPHFFPKKSLLKTAYIHHTLKHTLKRANRIIAISDFTRNDLHQFSNTTSNKIDVIHHGLDHPEWKISNAKIHHALNLENPYILCIAEKRPHKNLTTLIHAFSQMKRTGYMDQHLVICGKSYSDYTVPEDRARELGLEDIIHFTGYVSDETMATLYNNASLFVLPSLYEGFGFPLLEAMKAGVPVIAANTTAIPEIVGDAGILFEANNHDDLAKKMQNIIDNQSESQRLIARGLERATYFTWARAAKSTLLCYERAIRSHNNE